MAQSAKVIDKLPSFKRSLYSVLNDALREAGKDTLINARRRAPFQKGPLRANSDVSQVHPLQQRVSFWIEYARFQELGGDSRRQIRHYTTPGTGKGFLKKSGDEQRDDLRKTFSKHARRART